MTVITRHQLSHSRHASPTGFTLALRCTVWAGLVSVCLRLHVCLGGGSCSWSRATAEEGGRQLSPLHYSITTHDTTACHNNSGLSLIVPPHWLSTPYCSLLTCLIVCFLFLDVSFYCTQQLSTLQTTTLDWEIDICSYFVSCTA